MVGFTALVPVHFFKPASRRLRALALPGLAIISTAIFFHLGTPLAVDRVINEGGDTDGGVLLYMACGVWVSCLLIFFILSKKMLSGNSCASQ